MGRVRVKFCGIMRADDAIAAAQAGADAIGMVFYPRARRCIPLEQAQRILHALPAFVTPVALFVDQDIDEIQRTCTALHIRHVQLHGRETPELAAALRQYTVLKAIRADRGTLAAELQIWREAADSLDLQHLAGLVMESSASGGGSGIENDWAAIAQAQQGGLFSGLPPIIAAGGLSPENVAEVVRLLHPWAVDVSSGIEEQLGQKSPEKIRSFIEQVQLAGD